MAKERISEMLNRVFRSCCNSAMKQEKNTVIKKEKIVNSLTAMEILYTARSIGKWRVINAM